MIQMISSDNKGDNTAKDGIPIKRAENSDRNLLNLRSVVMYRMALLSSLDPESIGILLIVYT